MERGHPGRTLSMKNGDKWTLVSDEGQKPLASDRGDEANAETPRSALHSALRHLHRVQNSPLWPVFLQLNLNGVPHVILSLCPFPGLTTVLDNLASVWTVALTSQAREESRPGRGGRVECLFFAFFPLFFFFFFSPVLNNFSLENLGTHISFPHHLVSFSLLTSTSHLNHLSLCPVCRNPT